MNRETMTVECSGVLFTLHSDGSVWACEVNGWKVWNLRLGAVPSYIRDAFAAVEEAKCK